MKLTLLTIVAMTMVCYSLNAKELANAQVDTPDNTGMVDSGIRDGPDSLSSGPESPPAPQGDVREGVPIPLVPSENSSSHSGAQALSEKVLGAIDSEETTEEIGLFDFRKRWEKVTDWKNKKIQGGRDYFEKKSYASEYGEQNSTPENIAGIKEQKYAISKADEVRDQRELDRQVQQEMDELLYDDSFLCLTVVLWREARGETVSQEASTAMVIMNRLSVGFRDATTICQVITTPKQFTGINRHGIRVPHFKDETEKGSWERSLLIAKRMMDPDVMYIDTTNGALYYYNPEKVKRRTGKDWEFADDYRQTAILGSHRFMGEKRRKHKDYIDDTVIRINPVLFNGLSHDERNAMKKKFQSISRG